MPPPPLTFIDIPHIVDAVFEHISFKELYHCVFVSRAWHNTLIPRLWKDVASFRPVPDPNAKPPASWQIKDVKIIYEYCFQTPESLAALSKYAHHMRGLTCRGYDILPALLKAGISNLLELNFIIAERPPSTTLNFRHRPRLTPDLDGALLLKLVAANPALHALSVENIILYDKREGQALAEFVEALDAFPRINCFYLGGNFLARSWELKTFLLTVLERRLQRIDSSRVKTLEIKHACRFTRSKRGLSSLVGVRHPRSWPGGRWENEKHQLGSPGKSLAVIEHDGMLVVCAPAVVYPMVMTSILRQFPQIQRFYHHDLWNVSSQVFLELPESCRQLKEIDLYLGGVQGKELARLLSDPRVHLSSVHLHAIEMNTFTTGLHPFLFQVVPHFLCDALVTVTLSCSIVALSSALEILAVCSNLHTLSAHHLKVDGSEPEELPIWASTHLRVLNLGLFLKGGQLSDGRNRSQDLPASKAAAARIALQIMGQIGRQTYLQELHLLFNDYYYYNRSVFLELALECPNGNGLEQLGSLSRLEKFSVTGLLHSVGATEIAWMKEYWPRLKSISLPVFVPGTSIPAKHLECKQYMPDYSPWYSNLNVILSNANLRRE